MKKMQIDYLKKNGIGHAKDDIRTIVRVYQNKCERKAGNASVKLCKMMLVEKSKIVC